MLKPSLPLDQILAGDCREVLATLEPGSVDAVVTDPPYGIELDSEWRDRAGLNTAPGQKRTAASKATPIIDSPVRP